MYLYPIYSRKNFINGNIFTKSNCYSTKLRTAIGDTWWAPPSLTVINRPEIYYSIDPRNYWNVVGYIDSHHNEPTLFGRRSFFGTPRVYKYICHLSDHDSRLFSLLQQFGYQSNAIHDIRYLDVSNYKHKPNPKIATRSSQIKKN